MRTLAIFLFLLFTPLAYSQVTIGIKAGINLSNSNVSQSSVDLESDARTSFNAGAYMEMKISDKFTFDPELIVNTLGGTYTYSQDVGKGGTLIFDREWKPVYVAVPVIFGFKVIDKLSITGGLQLGVLAGGKVITSNVGSTDLKEKASDHLKATEFSTNWGLKYSITKKLNVSARYCIGLSNNAKSNPVAEKIKINTFQFTVGYIVFGKEKVAQ